MNSPRVISVSLGIIVGLVVIVALVVAAARLLRKLRLTRVASIVEPLRADLIRLASADDDGVDIVDSFVGLAAREWRAIRPHLIDLCRKVDRDSAGPLRSVLIERGVLTQAIRDTRRRSSIRRARAAMVLELFPTMESRAALIGLLHDRDADVRRMAVRGVGMVGDAACVPHVIALLHGPRRVAPTSVGHSLILLGSIAVDDLVATVQAHPDEQVVECCVEVLGHVGDPRAVPCLISALASSGPDSCGVRVVAARALGSLGSPQAISALVEGLKDGEAALTVACIDALVKIGAAAAVPHITATLCSVDRPVAAAAAGALTRFGDLGIEALGSDDVADDPSVIEALGRLSVRERHGLRTRVRVGA